jgi:AraC-like DNA-binding protein
MDQLRFSIPEILALIGAAQCIYIMVYMAFRAGRISRAGLPLLYFFVLATAFMTDFAFYYIGEFRYYSYVTWAAWFLGPPLSVLLVIQVAQISKVPELKYYTVLALVPFVFALSLFLAPDQEECRNFLPCEDRQSLLNVGGIIAGAVSLLAIWLNRSIFESIHGQKTGKDRYWLILSLIFINIFFLVAMLASLSEAAQAEHVILIRNILGLAFVYLVGTSLFRIYPQAVQIAASKNDVLSTAERQIASKIDGLMKLEKVYQEPTYSRSDLARECGVSEMVISRIINLHFQKSFPQMMNEYRVADARQLLKETNANIKTVAEDVGFNSLPSFNRVFKDIEGMTPSEYRKTNKI